MDAVTQIKAPGRAKGDMDIVAVVSQYRAKIGEEDAIVALHEDRQRHQDFSRYLSWQLFKSSQVPLEFISIALFENEEQAQEANSALQKDAWYTRLVSLTEMGVVHTQCLKIWQL